MAIKLSIAALAVVAAAAPFTTASAQQRTGVSKPEQVPVMTTPDGISQPVLYEDTNGAIVKGPVAPAGPVLPVAPTLKVRPEAAPQTVAAPRQRVTSNGEIVTETSAYVPYLPPGSVAPAVSARPSATERDDAAATRAEDRKPAADATPFDEGVVTRIAGPANQLPNGTLLKVKMREELSTTATAAGQVFHAELTEAVTRDGRTLLPAGSVISGEVTEVHGGKRISGAASLRLQPVQITLPDGTKYAVVGQVIDTNLYHSTKVDREGTIIRRDHAGETAAVFALSTGSGAAAGGLLGGVPGALIGGGIGAGVSTAMWLKMDRQTELPAGTRVVFALTSPMVVGGQ